MLCLKANCFPGFQPTLCFVHVYYFTLIRSQDDSMIPLKGSITSKKSSEWNIDSLIMVSILKSYNCE